MDKEKIFEEKQLTALIALINLSKTKFPKKNIIILIFTESPIKPIEFYKQYHSFQPSEYHPRKLCYLYGGCCHYTHLILFYHYTRHRHFSSFTFIITLCVPFINIALTDGCSMYTERLHS